MKKTVLALAAIAASSAAFAQSSVTLYGVVDMSVESVKGNTAGKSTTFNRVSSGNLATSRLGFKGVEDLGGGLKAKFQLEAGLNVDTGANGGGTSRFFDRAAWAGLASAEAGELRIGRQDSLIGAHIADAIGAQAYDASVVAATLGGVAVRRIDNALTYIAPTFVPGLTLSAQYSTAVDSSVATNGNAEANNGSVIGRAYGFAANFVQGPVSAGASYINVNSANKTATNGEQENVGLFAYGAYDLGVAKLTAFYNDDTNDGNRAVNGNRLYGVNVAVPVVTGLTVTGGYAYAKNATGYAFNSAGTSVTSALYGAKGTKHDNAGIITLKAQYDLSKRTAVYALFTEVQNGDKARLAITAATSPTINDKSSRGLAVGVRHAF